MHTSMNQPTRFASHLARMGHMLLPVTLFCAVALTPASSVACDFKISKVNLNKPAQSLKQILGAIQDENEANLAAVRDRLYNQWYELNGSNPAGSRQIASSWHGVLDELAPNLLENFEADGVSVADRLRLCNPIAEFYNSIAASGQPGAQWLAAATGT